MNSLLNEVSKSLERGHVSFRDKKKEISTRYLTVSGRMEVKLPGRESYKDVTSFSISYEEPMSIDIKGKIAEADGDRDRQCCMVQEGRLEVIAYRVNKTEEVLDRTNEKVQLNMRRIIDPEITIYQGDKKIILNQVIGIPVVSVNSGYITFLV